MLVPPAVIPTAVATGSATVAPCGTFPSLGWWKKNFVVCVAWTQRPSCPCVACWFSGCPGPESHTCQFVVPIHVALVGICIWLLMDEVFRSCAINLKRNFEYQLLFRDSSCYKGQWMNTCTVFCWRILHVHYIYLFNHQTWETTTMNTSFHSLETSHAYMCPCTAHWVTVLHLGLRIIHGLGSCGSWFVHVHIKHSEIPLNFLTPWHQIVLCIAWSLLIFWVCHVCKSDESWIGHIYIWLNALVQINCLVLPNSTYSHWAASVA